MEGPQERCAKSLRIGNFARFSRRSSLAAARKHPVPALLPWSGGMAIGDPEKCGLRALKFTSHKGASDMMGLSAGWFARKGLPPF
jgi:hypothetical protein